MKSSFFFLAMTLPPFPSSPPFLFSSLLPSLPLFFPPSLPSSFLPSFPSFLYRGKESVRRRRSVVVVTTNRSRERRREPQGRLRMRSRLSKYLKNIHVGGHKCFLFPGVNLTESLLLVLYSLIFKTVVGIMSYYYSPCVIVTMETVQVCARGHPSSW